MHPGERDISKTNQPAPPGVPGCGMADAPGMQGLPSPLHRCSPALLFFHIDQAPRVKAKSPTRRGTLVSTPPCNLAQWLHLCAAGSVQRSSGLRGAPASSMGDDFFADLLPTSKNGQKAPVFGADDVLVSPAGSASDGPPPSVAAPGPPMVRGSCLGRACRRRAARRDGDHTPCLPTRPTLPCPACLECSAATPPGSWRLWCSRSSRSSPAT